MHSKAVISLLLSLLYLFVTISAHKATNAADSRQFHEYTIRAYNASALYVRETISVNKVVIFSKTTCPYSTMAKEQFEKLNYPFFTIELDNRDDSERIQTILGEMTGATTVPRVFVNGNFIGGGTEVKKFYETGELKKILDNLIVYRHY